MGATGRGTAAMVLLVLGLLLPVGPAAAAIVDLDGDGLSDTFETTLSLTDPTLPDTDGNGTPDGQEDPDGDTLPNIWEQRLGLHPLEKDSDGDGKGDGREDADHDSLTNAAEVRWAVSDPRRRDSDGDGLRDSAEDPDDDRLGNRGELRYRTSAGAADSDGDGIIDGDEDADGDGLSDAAEQDARPVPRGLRPSLSAATRDLPAIYARGCHHATMDRGFHPCVLGTRGRKVALFGDSHAAQWYPALEALARQGGWRLLIVTKAGCPSVNVITFNRYFRGASPYCAEFRKRALAWLGAQRPDVVVLSNLGSYRLLKPDGSRVAREDRERRWARGLRATLGALPGTADAIVLADTPHPTRDVPACLAAHRGRIADCVTSRGRAVLAAHIAAERSAAIRGGATYGDLTRTVCSYDPCPVVVDELLLWRDSSHLSATYARQLAPSLGTIIARR